MTKRQTKEEAMRTTSILVTGLALAAGVVSAEAQQLTPGVSPGTSASQGIGQHAATAGAGEGQNITHQQKKMGLEGRGPLFSLHDTVIKINMQPKLQLLRALTILSQGPSLKIRTRQFCNFF